MKIKGTEDDVVLKVVEEEDPTLQELLAKCVNLENQNSTLNTLGIVDTLIDTRTIIDSQILQECRHYCAKQLYLKALD